MNIRNEFTIDRCPNRPDLWYVDWTELGPVETDIAKAKICEIVFEKVRPKWQIGIGYNVKYYTPKYPKMLDTRWVSPTDPIAPDHFEIVQKEKWQVMWISSDVWNQYSNSTYEAYGRYLFRTNNPDRQYATGIILETLDQAELFVDLMEAQFTFYMLKRTYATEW